MIIIYHTVIAGEDEISFDPDDVIENIEQVNALNVHVHRTFEN